METAAAAMAGVGSLTSDTSWPQFYTTMAGASNLASSTIALDAASAILAGAGGLASSTIARDAASALLAGASSLAADATTTVAFGTLRGTLSVSGGSIGANNDIAGSVSASVGDLVFAIFAEQSSLTCTGATDNLGNTYSALTAGYTSGPTSGRAFYSRVTTAGTLTKVTIAATSSTDDFAGVAAVIAGPFATSPLDVNPATVTDLASPFNCPATGTLAQASEVIMSCGTSKSPPTYTATSPTLLAAQAASAANIGAVLGYQTVAATTTVTPVFATAGSAPANAVWSTASFKGA